MRRGKGEGEKNPSIPPSLSSISRGVSCNGTRPPLPHFVSFLVYFFSFGSIFFPNFLFFPFCFPSFLAHVIISSLIIYLSLRLYLSTSITANLSIVNYHCLYLPICIFLSFFITLLLYLQTFPCPFLPSIFFPSFP